MRLVPWVPKCDIVGRETCSGHLDTSQGPPRASSVRLHSVKLKLTLYVEDDHKKKAERAPTHRLDGRRTAVRGLPATPAAALGA
eukprot:2864406-Prymnesium_polylepis.1